MKFGMFMEFQTRPEHDSLAAFREGFDLVDAAECWGLDSVWLAEFHFSPARSVLSSPAVVAGAIAARTERLRIGTAVYVLPLNNPLRIAEEAATLDHISHGRFELGVGRSGFTGFYRAYGISYEESHSRFEEAMAILPKAWSGERFSFEGKHYQITNAQVWPPPHQKPHPPLRVAATTPETFERVGAEGLPIFVGLRGDGLEELRTSLGRYRSAWRANGHTGQGSVFLRLPLYVGADHERACEDARETLTYYFERQSRLVAADAATRGGGDDTSGRARTASALAALEYEDILATRAVVGSPERIVEQLRVLEETLGLDGILAETNAGGLLAPKQVKESLRLLTHEVMRAFG